MTAADERELGTLHVIRMVAGRELRERLRAKSFYILTGLVVVLVFAIGLAGRFVSDDGPSTIEVAIVDANDTAMEPAVVATAELFDREAHVEVSEGAAPARELLSAGDADVVVDLTTQEVVFDDDADDVVSAIVQQAWASVSVERNLVDAGLSPEEAGAALAPEPLETVVLDAEEGDDDDLAALTGIMAAILLYISLQTFGGYVLTGVVEEKSSAVVEVLLARVRSDQLLAGKVVGIGMAALIQFAATVAAALGSLLVSGVDVPAEIWSAVPMTLVWFLTGYAFYSTLFALAGSLVSRQEDAQAASAPIMTALIGAYFLVFAFGSDPASTASRVLSLLPPIAPLLMPLRMAAGEATVAEVGLALVLLLAAIWGVWKLTGRIYSEVLLRRGSRISWREALAAAGGRG